MTEKNTRRRANRMNHLIHKLLSIKPLLKTLICKHQIAQPPSRWSVGVLISFRMSLASHRWCAVEALAERHPGA